MALTEATAALISGIAAAGAGTASTVSASKTNKRGAKLARELNAKNIQYQREANDLNYQRALSMWNMENEYNSPSAQMQRYADAGLNPNLIYQQENTASDIGAPDAVAPSSDMSEAEITANSSLPNLLPVVDSISNIYNRYHQENIDNEKLHLLSTDQLLKESALLHQKDMSEYQKRKLIADASVSEERADREKYLNSLEYRSLLFDQLRNTVDLQRSQIESSDLSNVEKRKRLDSLDETLRVQARIHLQSLANSILDGELKKLSIEKQEYAMHDDRLQSLLYNAVADAMEYVGIKDFIQNATVKILNKVKEYLKDL